MESPGRDLENFMQIQLVGGGKRPSSQYPSPPHRLRLFDKEHQKDDEPLLMTVRRAEISDRSVSGRITNLITAGKVWPKDGTRTTSFSETREETTQ
ncbi:hypothetical protein Trydic_g5933 [Trypoxylus dichotomus]